VRLARFTREDRAYGASRLPNMSENDCFAVYLLYVFILFFGLDGAQSTIVVYSVLGN